MTSEDTKDLLAPHVAGDLLILGAGQSVPVDTFVALFSEVEGPHWYASLKSEDKGPGRDRGYAEKIDQWHAEGLI